MHVDHEQFSTDLALLHAPVAILVVTVAGQVISSNYKARRILNYEDNSSPDIDTVLQSSLVIGKVELLICAY